jgi:L-alanine-DL-glutamate epimerase-like enolase superfamily enzyme
VQRVKTLKIQAAECRLPLPRPIRLGPVSITTRDVVVLRITTDSGLEGDALGYTRGTPLLETIRHLGHHFIGVNPLERVSVINDFRRSLVNGAPGLVRAISLFDIALTDLAAKSLELPLFRLLGGGRTRIPALAVAGYYLNERSIASVRDEVAALMDQGFTRAKVMLAGGAPASDAKLVEASFDAAHKMLAADAHWSWRTVPEALETCRLLDDIGLIFLEDPFGPNMASHLARLQSFLKTPLAAGEDSPDIDALFAISKAAAILRVDATTCGGITAAGAAIHAAGLQGCEVFPHVHHYLHAQLASAFSEIRFVEIIPEATAADPTHLLLQRIPRIEEGSIVLDEEPGAGTNLNWASVENFSVNTVVL